MASLTTLFTAAALAAPGGGAATEAPRIADPHAGGGQVLLAGKVADKAGLPIAGPVSVSLMPRDIKTGESYPIVATGLAGADGRFVARVTDPKMLAKVAKKQNGWIETVTSADNAVSASSGLRSLQIKTSGDKLQIASRASVLAARSQGVLTPAATPTVDLAVVPPRVSADGGRRAKETRACPVTPLWKTIKSERQTKWTVIGELNNAHNDGTVAKFEYGRNGNTETTFGIATALNGASASISETNQVEDNARLQFPEFKRRLSRKMRTGFEYLKTTEKRECEATGVSDTRTTIRAVAWKSGTDTNVKQKGGLNRCRRDLPTYARGTSFTRDRNRAVRWDSGVDAFGVYLTTQSGFSQNVVVSYEFGKSKTYKYYLCGSDGGSSANRSGRITAGAVAKK